MEHGTSTKKLSGRARQIEEAIASFTPMPPELELPVAPDFVSKPPHLDPQAMFRRCEEMQRYRNLKIEAERRHADRVDVEFVL